ncbi:YopT-type cysteine protease domain-containing protein [Labrys okinawensis]|uniref:YopT-type cysteine protease domain-containing protein n=1 Tax=Labrys okinawensis TaxID=346911 RepID=UPI0039BC6506
MAGQNRFQALKKWATKEMKFQQGRNMFNLEPAALLAGNVVNHVSWNYATYDSIRGGICASLVADWLKEKVLGSNSLFSTSQKTFTAGGGDDKNSAKVASLMRSAAPGQIEYAANGNIHNLYKGKELYLHDAPAQKNKGSAPTYQPVTDIQRSFRDLCEGTDFQGGAGLVMSMTFLKIPGGAIIARHAVGAYKSKAGQVHFFDPNVGIYKLNSFSGFITAWISAYEAQGMQMTMNQLNDGFYFCDDKP